MKKVLSILLTIIMLFTMVPASVFAADGITVKLVSFMRGEQEHLRSSELLEARVSGYDGNPQELTYRWTNTLGTYLYVYNSHNMYHIRNTPGEVEVYNTKKNTPTPDMYGRYYPNTFTGTGFAWAAVYSSNLYDKGRLVGTVTVEVLDGNGNVLCSDTHEGVLDSNGNNSGFIHYDLREDLDDVVIGLFEGDTRNVKDLLGESAVVHIVCIASKVMQGYIESGSEYISLYKGSDGDYYIDALKAGTSTDESGDALVNLTVQKSSCKFHAGSYENATTTVFVFKKPTTSTTTTTLTLVDNIDDRCEYFIDGNKGVKQSDGTVLFTGLDPNTEYMVEVRAKFDTENGKKYAYAYVYDTTKPAYKATVKTYLDDTIKDVADIHGEDVELLLSKDGKNFVELKKTATGTYEAVVDNGTYFPYHYENGTYHQARNYELIIENANAELHLHHYSVNYDTNGGAFKADEEVGTEVYSSSSAVNATSNVPVRDGFIFTGWDYNGKVIGSGKQVTASITSPVTLKAKWEKAVNVTINVIIDHKTVDGFDPNTTRADLDVDFLEMTANSPAFVETGDKLLFRKDTVKDENGNAKPYTYTLEDNVSTYTATDYTYTGLLESSTFGVALSKSGYAVGAIEKKQDKLGNWIINIPLTYNPDDFDLDFHIEMADDVPTELYPDAVIVKIAYWNTETNEWKIISQQANAGAVVKPGVRVDIDPATGEGFGSYPVWRFDGDNNPYGYRAVVTGFIYGDSTITVPQESINGLIATYSDNNYTATMGDVADGKKYTALNGAYYDASIDDQAGTLDGVITVEKYDVTFDANGGTVNGGNTFTETDEYYVPDVDNYVPSFDGHEFGGWYKDPEFKEPAVTGEILKENITVYAKWDQILTGYVRVAGSYMQDGNIVDVWAVDRANSAVIALMEITANGSYIVDSQTVNIVWPMSEMIYGVSDEYKFTGLDPAKEYRTEILVLNYGTTYQNSTTVFVNDDNYADDYNTNDFKAVYPESSKWETFVNAYLSFEPASYFQPVEVDATLIGENLRPDDTLVEIWYKATGTDNAYQVISQHTVVPYGIEIGMGTDGMDDSDYGYTVWNSIYDGNLYDYQAYLSKIENDKASEWPVSVVYGAPSRYSPLHNAPTGVLKVKIIPNTYSIIFNEIYESEDVSVVSYAAHTWSYETAIDYVPVRDGYVFEGWYSNPECTGEKVTEIAASVAEDTELYARWEKRTDLEIKVNYIDKDTNKVLESETKTAQTFGNVITAESLKKEFKGYSYDSASAESVTIGTETNEITLYYVRNSYGYTVNYLEEGTDEVLAAAKNATAAYGTEVTEDAIVVDGYTLVDSDSKSITIDTENNVINFYYAADSFGDGENGDEGDGTPDKYQKKVIFKVVNGKWADGTNADKVVYLDLMKDGKYAVDGTATLTAPTGMVADEGFKNGSWDAEIPTTVSGTETLTFTYDFDRSTTPVEPLDSVSYIVEHYKENADGTYSLVEEDTEILKGKIGATVTATAKTYEDYCLNEIKSEATASGVLKAISSAEDILTLKLYYDIDTVGGENGDAGDGTPDKYQKKVTFKVENGTWADGTEEDIVVYVTLETNGEWDENGTGTIVIPEGMLPDEGFEGGAWDVTPSSSVSGTNDEVYTHTFTEVVPEEPTDPSDPVDPEDPTDPDAPVDPDVSGGEGEGEGSLNGGAHHILFGKTDGIGWYKVSQDGGQTWDTVFGNSTYEVKHGTEIIIRVGDLMGDTFTFYVNGDKYYPDENGQLVITVNGYMLIGAVSVVPEIDFEVPDVEESLNWFQKIIKAIKDFFDKIFGWMK